MFLKLLQGKKITFSKVTLAVLALVGVAYGYSILGVNTRILEKGFTSMTQVYVRVGAGFLLSLIIFRKSISIKKLKKISKNDWFWLLMMGTFGYSVGVWLVTLAALNTKLVNSAVVASTLPFVVYFYSFFLLKEKIRPKLILFLSLALYGVAVVASKSFIPRLDSFGIGEVFAMLHVFSAAWWSVGRKKLSNFLDNKEISLIVMAIAALSGLIIATLRGESLNIAAFGMPMIWLGIAIGAGLNFLLVFLENFAFQNIDIVIGNQILRLSVIFALFNGFIFYQEFIGLPEFTGGMLILVSVLAGNKMLRG